MKKRIAVSFVLASTLVLAVAAWAAESKSVTKSETVTATAVVDAIDHAKRIVTFKGPEGNSVTLRVPEDVKRFGEVKVGDKLNVTYRESYVYTVRKPGVEAAPMGASEAVTKSSGTKPGVTMAEQERATVVVEAVDMKIPSITVKTEDGRSVSFKVEEKKNLEGVKPGDKIDITYTTALVVSMEAPKK